MKFNEPVRPAGIGRKQVAFDLNRNPSAFTIVEEQGNNHTDPESNEAQNIATLAQADAHARAIAYSAASSAMSNNQNEIWGVRGVDDFSIEAFSSSAYVKWGITGTKYRTGLSQINNPFLWIDNDDNSKIRINRSGWWLVDAMVAIENYKNSTNYALDIVIGGQDDMVALGFDIVHTNQYPTLRVNALVPVPVVTTDPNSVTDNYFQIRFTIVGFSSSEPVTIQADGFIHAIWLKPWEADEKPYPPIGV